jgi:ankyrin repeat protein
VKAPYWTFVFLAITASFISCASFDSSSKYQEANIHVATNALEVADMQFVNGDVAEIGYLWGPQQIGIMMANDLEKAGYHDVTVLIELVSRGYGNQANLWRRSVYRAKPLRESQVVPRGQTAMSSSTDLFRLVQTGTSIEVINALSAGADPNAREPKKGGTPLMAASFSNPDPYVILLLLRAGADLNAQDQGGMSSLMYASGHNPEAEVTATLLRAGANVNAQDQNGMTPLAWASQSNYNPDVITMLVKSGANLETPDTHGATPLMNAALTNTNPKVIIALLSVGANINEKDPKIGATALMLAASNNKNPEVVSALLKAGANGKETDNRGLTAYDYAGNNKNLAGSDALSQLQEAAN